MEEDFQKAIDDLREVIKLMSLELSQKLDPIVPGGFHFSEDIYQKLKIKREETIQSNDNDLKVKKLTSSIPISYKLRNSGLCLLLHLESLLFTITKCGSPYEIKLIK